MVKAGKYKSLLLNHLCLVITLCPDLVDSILLDYFCQLGWHKCYLWKKNAFNPVLWNKQELKVHINHNS